MLIGVASPRAASGLVLLIEAGWTKWLYLPFLLFIWNGGKFVCLAPSA